MAYRPYVGSARQKHTTTIRKFLGVDYSSQKFLISDGRAIDILNYIYKDGVIQKRNGFEEIYKLKPFSYVKVDFDGKPILVAKENTTNFNGIWRMKFEDNEFHTIAHIGKLLYEVKDIENNKIEFVPILFTREKVEVNGRYYYQCYEYENIKSSAFNGGDKLWFLGGNKFMLIRFLSNYGLLITPVEDSDFAPIPVTQISITYKNARVSGRQNLDRVNLLNTFRKNKLISGVGKNEDEKNKTDFYEYTLDAPLICKDKHKDMAKFKMTISERGSY